MPGHTKKERKKGKKIPNKVALKRRVGTGNPKLKRKIPKRATVKRRSF